MIEMTHLPNTKILAITTIGNFLVNMLLVYLLVIRAADIGFDFQWLRAIMPYFILIGAAGHAFASNYFRRQIDGADALAAKDFTASALLCILTAALLLPVAMYYFNSTPLSYGQ